MVFSADMVPKGADPSSQLKGAFDTTQPLQSLAGLTCYNEIVVVSSAASKSPVVAQYDCQVNDIALSH